MARHYALGNVVPQPYIRAMKRKDWDMALASRHGTISLLSAAILMLVLGSAR